MKELLNLGKLYVSDFLESDESPRGEKVELKLMLTEDGNVRLETVAPMNTMYGKYWYRSGINNTMKNELKDIVKSIENVFDLNDQDLWLDIASNDGTLLSFVPKNIYRVGIDPADETFCNEALKYADFILQDFFSAELYNKFGPKIKPKVITSIAMFYDLEYPEKFINDVEKILDNDGLWVLQLSYTPLMIEQLAFDNILHEHIYYYSLFNLKKILERNGFQIMDCILNDINGGSFRIYVMKQSANISKFGSQSLRGVANFRIKSLLSYENTLNLDKIETWIKFSNDVTNLKNQVLNFIKKEKENGKIIWGYGSSTKGNTLLQYFGLDNSLIDGIAERSPYKYGKRTVGTNIPILSEEEMRKVHPDYLLILPWHFINEFKVREKEYLNKGGKFIVPCPKFEIIGK